MAMKNAKSLKRALKSFFKENGREASTSEFSKIVNGSPKKKVKTNA